MVFLHGFVHADMHPGNVILTSDGRVVLIDLGMTARIPPELLRPWVEAFYALSQQDGPKLARLLYGYAPSVNIPDYAAYEADLVKFFSQYYGRNLGDVEVSEVITGVLGLLRRHQIENDPVFTVVCIGVVVAEGIGKQLDPSLDIVTIAIPYLLTAMSVAPPAMKPLREPPT
jgi:ubiquinone biosynthesis protein